MEKSFIFESDHFNHEDLCDRVQVTIDVTSTDRSMYTWKYVSMINTDDDDKELKLEDFPEEEQDKIHIIAVNLADKSADEAFEGYLDRLAEHAGDAIAEGDL